MKEIQLLRTALFDELARIKRGTTTNEESVNLVKVSNAILKSYEVEIKAASLILNAEERGMESAELGVLDATTEDIKVIDMKANDE